MDNTQFQFTSLMSLFKHIKPAPPDPIFGVAIKYEASKHPHKQIFAVGVYRTEEGKPYVFPSVRKAEERIANKHFKDYLPMTGHPQFVQSAKELLWGEYLPKIGDRIGSVQTIAGTGGLSVVSMFAKKNLDFPTVMISDPAWPNYKCIFGDVGHHLSYYPWVKDGRLDLNGTLDSLKNAPDGSLCVMQACAHNPSGVDPNNSEWEEIFDMVNRKNHTIFFDFAYMGFASGNMDKDAEIVRKYALTGKQFFVSYSFSKCMGLYGERIGCLHAVCANPSEAKALQTNFASVMRSTISVAPQNGALIAHEILSNPELKNQWVGELKSITNRIIDIRGKLCNKLEKLTSRDWSYLKDQKGMFGYTGLTKEQCDRLAEVEGVFITDNGRISVPALNNSNVDSVAKAIANVVRK